jgi:hypothetical protein
MACTLQNKMALVNQSVSYFAVYEDVKQVKEKPTGMDVDSSRILMEKSQYDTVQC